ncbi:hypothetical protein HDV00_001375 [Rhizophlyctis rosea]|nr:hypothetical protein HDV00_001375 [Rhizophlyctis rosea]
MPDWAPYVSNPLGYHAHEHNGFIIELVIALAIVFVAVGCAGSVAVSFESGKFRGMSLMALKTLRLVTALGGTILLMPILEVLFVAVDCVPPDGHMSFYPTTYCFADGNSVATVLAVIGLACFLPYMVAMTSVYFDISPSMPTPMSRSPLGRVDFWYTLVRIILVTVFTFSSNPTIQIAFLIPCLCFLCYIAWFYQQFYHRIYNEIRSAVWTAALFTSVIAAAAYGSGKGDTDAVFALVFVFLGLGLVVGVAIVKGYRAMVERRVYQRLQEKHAQQSTHTNLTNPFSKQKSGIGSALERGDFDESKAFADINTIVRTHTVKKEVNVFWHPGEVEIACRFLFHNREPEALFLAERIFEEGFRQFPRNAMLNLIYANYVITFIPGRDQDAIFHITRAKKLKPTFDAKFFLFMQDRTIEQLKRTQGLNSSTMNISSYVEFQTMQNGARANHLSALVELREFLTHVRSSSSGKDPSTYPIFLQRISEAEQRANAYYQKLVARWPKSKVLLRMYATFLLQVKNDTETATRLMAIADEIEDYETYQNTIGGLRRGSSIQVPPPAFTQMQNAGLRNNSNPCNMLGFGAPRREQQGSMDGATMGSMDGNVPITRLSGLKSPPSGMVQPRKSSLKSPLPTTTPPTAQVRQIINTGLYEDPESDDSGKVAEQPDLDPTAYPQPLPRSISLTEPVAEVAENDSGDLTIPDSSPSPEKERWPRPVLEIPHQALKPRESPPPRPPSQQQQQPLRRSASFGRNSSRADSMSTDSSEGDLSSRVEDRFKALKGSDSYTGAAPGGNEANKVGGRGEVVFRSQLSVRSDPEKGAGGKSSEFNPYDQRSESNPSTKSEERQARQQVMFRTQMESRMKTPVKLFDVRQKGALLLFIAIMCAAVGLGVYQFNNAQTTFQTFRISTVIGFNAIYIIATLRFLSLMSVLQNPDMSRWASNIATLKSKLNIFNNTILPYVITYHDDTSHIAQMEISQWPSPQTRLMRMNPYYVAQGVYERGLNLAQQDITYFATNTTQNNDLRFFFDNMLQIGDLFMDVSNTGKINWINYTLQNSYISWAFIAAIVIVILAWLFLLIRPMMQQTHEEQVRALKMFALVPRKSLLAILTRVEEPLATFADVWAGAIGGVGGGGGNAKGSRMDLGGTSAGATAAAKELLMRRAYGKGEGSSNTKYFKKFVLALVLVGLGAIGILVPPLVRVYNGMALAGLMNYAGSRRYYSQAVQMMTVECVVQDRSAWRTYEAEMWLRDRLDMLETIHSNVIQGIGVKPPADLPQLYGFTTQSAPCNAACGNRTLGLDGQIDAFIQMAEAFWSALGQGQIRQIPGTPGNPMSDAMWLMNQNLATNLKSFDDIILSMVSSGNQTAQTIMIVLFAVTVVGTFLLYVTVLRVTTKQRMTEMDSVVTLIFTLPENVVEEVPEIKRFIESGGMFTDAGGYRSSKRRRGDK